MPYENDLPTTWMGTGEVLATGSSMMDAEMSFRFSFEADER